MDPQASAPNEPEQQTPAQPEQPAQSPATTPKGYGKRPVWQWVVIYLIVAIIVYGLVYLLFFNKGASNGSFGY